MAFPVNPLFHYLPRRVTFDTLHQVVLTDAGAAAYNEKYSTTCFAMGTLVGHVSYRMGRYDVFNAKLNFLGALDNRYHATEELVKLYARQHTPVPIGVASDTSKGAA